MRVKIKSWKAMEKEFGLDDKRCIKCEEYFTIEMEVHLPTDRIIEVRQWNVPGIYIWNTGNSIWNISNDMIEEYL